VFTGGGLGMVGIATVSCLLFAYVGRGLVPPVPAVMDDGAVGHGRPGQYECLPSKKREIRADRLALLRCGSIVSEPGGLKSSIRHVWRRGRKTIITTKPVRLDGCAKNLLVSHLADAMKAADKTLPADMTGKWTCTVQTEGGMLLGRVHFKVVDAPTHAEPDAANTREKLPAKPDKAATADAGL